MGGGIRCSNSDATIANNLIYDNISDWCGGGIAADGCTPNISNNTIVQNECTGQYSGGICAIGSSGFIGQNNIIWDNNASYYPEVYGTVNLTYSCCSTALTGTGNITDNPLFVDTTNNDFHLQSTVGSYHGGSWLPDPSYSPCIDTGDPESAFYLEPMPNGGRINMGAFGGTEEASLSMNPAVGQEYAGIPVEYQLHQNYPNPFNHTTAISFELPVSSLVKLEVFDINGRCVGAGFKPAPTSGSWYPPGIHRISFDGSGLASGIYIYRLQAGDFSSSGKMVLMK